MILAVLQARCSSTRLPGKVLKPILGVPMLLRQIERVKRSACIEKILVATSDDPSDDPIESICEENGIVCFRGKLDDVLDRFYQAASLYLPLHVVRLTGDCPLSDPDLIDRVIRFHLQGEFDYTSNALEPTFPDGLDVEIFRYSCLEKTWHNARSPADREHVTPYMYRTTGRAEMGSYTNRIDLSHLRWTVDEEADFLLITRIYEALYVQNPFFATQDILDYLFQNPELLKLNSQYKRNERYQSEGE
jgi:spore coat polysaccharide biosynthesis protein SpsF